VLVMFSKYTLLQTAGILVVYFFAVIAQDNARPYDREMVDNFEFLQLLTCHFVLLLGMVYYGAEKTLEIATTCDGTNGTVVSVECTHEETKRSVTKFYQWMASFAILIVVVASVLCGGLTIWTQVQTVIKKKLKVDKQEEADRKFEALVELAEAVMNPEMIPATREWLEISTPSEREYFHHLLTLLNENYDDYQALQSKHFSDFLERSQEQLIDNGRFLGKFCQTVTQILCCLRVRKKKVNSFNQQQSDADAKVKSQKSRFRFGRKRKAAEEGGRKKDTPTGHVQADEEDDDLVEAYLRARAQQQARNQAEAERNSAAERDAQRFLGRG